HQPDHWVTSSFPQSLGHTAVLGVRRSDAHEFCNWLTKRESETRQYRLPKSGEPEQAKESASEVSKLKAGTGYWGDGDKEFMWVEGTSPLSDNIIQELLDNSFARDYSNAYQQSLDPNHSGHQFLSQCLSFAKSLREARELYSALISALTSIYHRLLE